MVPCPCPFPGREAETLFPGPLSLMELSTLQGLRRLLQTQNLCAGLRRSVPRNEEPFSDALGRTSAQNTGAWYFPLFQPMLSEKLLLRQRSINFLSSDLRMLSRAHVFSLHRGCDRVSRPPSVKEAHDEPEDKNNDLRNRGKQMQQALLPDTTSERPASLWG